MCWCSVPPQATLSAWAPRQMARIGRSRVQRLAGEAQLEGVEARLGRAELDVAVGRAVGRRVEVRAAGQADAVEAVEQRREVIGADRRQHDGDRAGRVQRAQIGHPERHLGVRGLAVAARRRQRAGAQLRSGDADQRPHTADHRQRGRIDAPTDGPSFRPAEFARRSAFLCCSGAMSSQYIYTMYKLSRTHPPDKTVLKDISLSFFPGAKIGVLGLNGTGKSTLLRIMAGKDKDYRGEAQLAPGATVGLLEQEPHLDESKDVRGNVEDGVRGLRDLLDRFNELSMNYSDETADEFARLQDQIDAAGAWELDQMLDQAMDALRCPPGDCGRDVAFAAASGAAWPWRGCCCPSPTCCCSTSPRTTWTPSRVAWLEQHLADYKGTIVAVTHDRYFLDNVAGWILELDRGHGHPVQGQLLLVARAEGEAARAGGEDRVGPPAHDQAGARVGAHEPEGPPHQVARAPEPLRGAAGRGAQREARGRPDPHPGRPAARRDRDRGRAPAQGLRRQAADRGPLVLAAARRASSA